MLPVLDRVIWGNDYLQLDRAGVVTMLALERYRTDHGSYPARLAELVPVFIPELPLDPWSGAPLRYRLTDPATDPQGRPYLLYSIGADGQDNGGTPVPDSDFSRALRESIPNDFILNDKRR
jgi:hypothetical protein